MRQEIISASRRAKKNCPPDCRSHRVQKFRVGSRESIDKFFFFLNPPRLEPHHTGGRKANRVLGTLNGTPYLPYTFCVGGLSSFAALHPLQITLKPCCPGELFHAEVKLIEITCLTERLMATNKNPSTKKRMPSRCLWYQRALSHAVGRLGKGEYLRQRVEPAKVAVLVDLIPSCARQQIILL